MEIKRADSVKRRSFTRVIRYCCCTVSGITKLLLLLSTDESRASTKMWSFIANSANSMTPLVSVAERRRVCLGVGVLVSAGWGSLSFCWELVFKRASGSY